MCRSSLRLPPGYDRMRIPMNPIDIRVEFDTRRVRRVREEQMSYRVVLSFVKFVFMQLEG